MGFLFLLNLLSILFLHLYVLLDVYLMVYVICPLHFPSFHHIFYSISIKMFSIYDISYIHSLYLHIFYTFLTAIFSFLFHVVNISSYFLFLCYNIIHKWFKSFCSNFIWQFNYTTWITFFQFFLFHINL